MQYGSHGNWITWDMQRTFGVNNGALSSSVSATGCQGKTGQDYVCGGTSKWIKWNVNFGSSDFVIESTFRADVVSGTALTFSLWSGYTEYYIGLDGGGNTLFYQGNAPWGLVSLGATSLDPSRYQKIELRRLGNNLLITFDGKQWSPLPINFHITAIGWRPWRNTIHVKNLLHY